MLARAPPRRLPKRAAWLLVIAAVAGCNGGGDDATPQPDQGAVEPRPERRVTMVAVTSMPIERTVDISGTIDAYEQVTVGAKVPGRLASIAVDLASPVVKGQVIARLETTDYQLRVDQARAAVGQSRAVLGLTEGQDKVDVDGTAVVRQAQATLQEAQANLRRTRALSAEGLATGIQMDSAEATALRAETALQSAREEVRIREATLRQRGSELSLARQQLADTVLISPIDGVVQARRGSVGEYFAAGAPLVDIVRIDPLRLRVALPEREAGSVREGQSVRLTIAGDERAYGGTIARLAPALDQESRTLLVEADIGNPGNLRPGTMVSAKIVVASDPGLTLPLTAVVQFAGLTKVLTVEDGRAREKQITTGRATGDRVEILSGVADGERVVDKPGSLQQGEAVQPAEGG